jgi:hypothetical protein
MAWIKIIAAVGMLVSSQVYTSNPYEGASAPSLEDEGLYPSLEEYKEYKPTVYKEEPLSNGDLTEEEALRIALEESKREAEADRKKAQKLQEEEDRKYAQRLQNQHPRIRTVRPYTSHHEEQHNFFIRFLYWLCHWIGSN